MDCVVCGGVTDTTGPEIVDLRFGVPGTYQVARCRSCGVEQTAKATVRVTFGLKGTLHPSSRYRLTLIDQPLVNPDHLDVRVSGPTRITGSEVSGPFRLSPVEGDDARYRGLAVGGVENFTVRFLSQT